MARLPRSRFPHQARSKRTFDWIGGLSVVPGTTSNIAPATSVIHSAFDTRIVGQSPGSPFTIIRVRGLIVAGSDQDAADELVLGAAGICIVNGEAFDAGVASIITPWSESFDDRWLWHQYIYAPIKFVSSTGLQQFWFNQVIDSKAMRKVETGDVIVTMIENANTTDSMRVFINKRTGVKLH